MDNYHLKLLEDFIEYDICLNIRKPGESFYG